MALICSLQPRNEKSSQVERSSATSLSAKMISTMASAAPPSPSAPAPSPGAADRASAPSSPSVGVGSSSPSPIAAEEPSESAGATAASVIKHPSLPSIVVRCPARRSLLKSSASSSAPSPPAPALIPRVPSLTITKVESSDANDGRADELPQDLSVKKRDQGCQTSTGRAGSSSPSSSSPSSSPRGCQTDVDRGGTAAARLKPPAVKQEQRSRKDSADVASAASSSVEAAPLVPPLMAVVAALITAGNAHDGADDGDGDRISLLEIVRRLGPQYLRMLYRMKLALTKSHKVSSPADPSILAKLSQPK